MLIRFRASIYLDVFIEGDSLSLEQARTQATDQVRNIVALISTPDDCGYLEDLKNSDCCNAYVGGVAKYTPNNLFKPLDREI